MTQEIIYTSAPSGLKPGSRGFCTVVATRGLAKPLADQLEDLSGYRHIFLSNDANSALNPIVFSHLKLSIAGRTYHVLSRICDAGLDYTQRTNKLAHHVTLEPRELTASGPATLLSTPGFMTTSWSGEPAIRESGPVAPRVDSAPGVCREWGRLTGDPGWGGYIAEALLADARKQVVLVYRPGTNVLTLVAETLALLPANRRWEVTFCTYFTKLPPTVDCRWRCVVDGTPEADTLARSTTAIVVDLRKPLAPPAGSPYVSAARTGIPVPQISAALSPIRSSVATVPTDQDDVLLAALGATSADDSTEPQRRQNQRTREPSYPAQAYGLAPPPIANDAAQRNASLHIALTKGATGRTLRPVVFLSIACIGLLVIGGLGTYLFSIINTTMQKGAETAQSPAGSLSTPTENAATIEPKPSVTPRALGTHAATAASNPDFTPAATPPAATPPAAAPPAAAPPAAAPPAAAPPAAAPPAATPPATTPPATTLPATTPPTPTPPAPTPPAAMPAPTSKVSVATSSQVKESAANTMYRTQYFDNADIDSLAFRLPLETNGDRYKIELHLNDSSQPLIKRSLADNRVTVSQPKNPLADESVVAEYSIETTKDGRRDLVFVGQRHLSSNAVARSILKTSLIIVSFYTSDGSKHVERIALRPVQSDPMTFAALMDGSQTLPSFGRPPNATLHFRTQLESQGNLSPFVETSGIAKCNVALPISDDFKLPCEVWFVENSSKLTEMRLEVDTTSLRQFDSLLCDSLININLKTSITDQTISSAEKSLGKKLNEAKSAIQKQQSDIDVLAKLRRNPEPSELAGARSLLQQSIGEEQRIKTTINRLGVLKKAHSEFRNPATSKKYLCNVEVFFLVGAEQVMLLRAAVK